MFFSCRAKRFRVFVLLLALISAPSIAREEQKCPAKALAAFQVSVPIGGDDTTRASVCKLWPDDKSKMLIAVITESETGEMQYPVHVALINAETFQVLSRAKTFIEADATNEIYSSSLWLDTARYFLNKDTRAFGLRVSSFRDRCTYSGGFDNELKLFVIEGSSMRPVLQGLYMSSWRYEGNRCGSSDEEVTEKRVDLSLSVEPTHTNGYADLLITATSSDSKKRGMKMQYNGKQYSPIPHTGSFLD